MGCVPRNFLYWSEMCLEGVRMASERCLEGVLRVSGKCLEEVLKVSGLVSVSMCLECVWIVAKRCL